MGYTSQKLSQIRADLPHLATFTRELTAYNSKSIEPDDTTKPELMNEILPKSIIAVSTRPH